MLVLSRKVGESITIGDDITITVLEVRGTRVVLGIDAPREQRVMRTELCSVVADFGATQQTSVLQDAQDSQP